MAVIKLVPGLFALLRMRNDRVSRINAAPAERKPDPISEMARAMHPEELRLVVRSVTQENETARTYRLAAAAPAEPPALPVFQPGQYISVKLSIDGIQTSRAYTIASAPAEAGGDSREAGGPDGGSGFYEITVRRKPGGFADRKSVV